MSERRAAAAAPLSILMTNVVLTGRTGTEVATIELALALRARGHRIAVYAPLLGEPLLGEAARTLMTHGVPVTDRIETVGFVPDILHGHHNTALAVAMVRFAATPAIFVCHDSAQSFDAPILSPRIAAYVAVDAACLERLVAAGVPADRAYVIPNGIDLDRFVLRSVQADRPTRALVVTKHHAPHLPAVREACAAEGLVLQEVGPAAGRVVADLAPLCAEADIVFAMSRAAMEAAATGAAVVICDEHGCAGLLRAADVSEWPETALSRRQPRPPATVAALRAAIRMVRPAAALQVAELLRARVDIGRIAGEYEALYSQVLRRGPPGVPADEAALAGFVAGLLPRFGARSESEARDEQDEARRRAVDAWFAAHGGSGGPVEAVRFGRDAEGALLLEEGWHPAEAWGVWSRTESAHLRLPVPVLRGWGGEARFECRPYFAPAAPPDEAVSVEVLADGRPLAQWRFAADDPPGDGYSHRRLQLSEACLDGRPSVRLTLRTSRVASPAALGGADTRVLGLALCEVAGPRQRPSDPPS